MRKSTLEVDWKYSMQKGTRKNSQFKSKIKIAKKMRKTTLEAHWKCSMRETVRKNSQYWKNETILKIGKNGRHAKAIALAKW